MRTRTSIAGLSSSALERFLQPPGNRIGHQRAQVAAEHRELLHAARAQEAVLRRGEHVDALDVGGQFTVQLVHLELVLEVRDRAQALHDGPRSVLASEIDEQRSKGLYLHVA